MIIYQNLSAGAEQTFASAWGVSQALDQAQQVAPSLSEAPRPAARLTESSPLPQWKDVMTETVQSCVIVVIFDLLLLSSDRQWFED